MRPLAPGAPERVAWQAAGKPLARAVWEAPPVGGGRLHDDEVTAALRLRFAISTLPTVGLACQVAGAVCKHRGVATRTPHAHSADRHAAVCKLGGYVQAWHDGMRDVAGGRMLTWGCPVRLEDRAWLPGPGWDRTTPPHCGLPWQQACARPLVRRCAS